MESKTEVRLNYVLSMGSKPDEKVVVVTDQSGTLIATAAKRVEQLESYEARRALVVIEFDPSSREILRVYPPKKDLLKAVGDAKAEGDSVRVHALKSPTLYSLRKDHPRFVELHALLGQAQASGATVALAIPPGGDQVQDARLVEKGAP